MGCSRTRVYCTRPHDQGTEDPVKNKIKKGNLFFEQGERARAFDGWKNTVVSLTVKGLDTANVNHIVDNTFLVSYCAVIVNLCDLVWTVVVQFMLRFLSSSD